MKKEQKAEVVEQVASQIQESEAVFAVDYRGISVPQAAELRSKLNEAGAPFRGVKKTPPIPAPQPAGARRAPRTARGDGGVAHHGARARSEPTNRGIRQPAPADGRPGARGRSRRAAGGV